MKRRNLIRFVGIVLWLGFAIVSSSADAQTSVMDGPKQDPYSANNRPPDPRFKADILVVVAHPDDETMATAYLAREIYDHHKQVAIVYGTHGDGGNNDVGPEQASAMGNIREIEARRADSVLGITNVWFLDGLDTASQNVLNSLLHWGHGRCLDELVQIVRLTRPSVILTFLPDFTTGENHADHQAAGVLATEAFDLAGDPTAFSEQVSPVTHPDQNMNMTEGLRPWQPEKIYYFYNPTHDIFTGQGPQYSSKEISPSRNLSYGRLAADVFVQHRTQGGGQIEEAIHDGTLEDSKNTIARIVTGPTQLIFGKSLVPSGTTDDVFTGVHPEGVLFQSHPGFSASKESRPSLRIGDPWSFYQKFWQAHGLEHLSNIVPLEVSVHVSGALFIPLVVDNPLDTAAEVHLSVRSPDGWTVTPPAPISVAPHTQYYTRVRAEAPHNKLPGWQSFAVTAHSGGNDIGTVSIRAELSSGWVAPQ